MNWRETIEVSDAFHDDKLSFDERRDAIVATVKASRWYKRADRSAGRTPSLLYVVEALSDSETEDEFDSIWNDLYDMADRDHVWINTHRGLKAKAVSK
jgi:hypothetical protein